MSTLQVPGDAVAGVAVVTGASRGIGAALVECLVPRFQRVVGLARQAPQQPIRGVEYLQCDVTDETRVTDTFASIGPVSALINNAGQSSSNPILRTSLQDWDSALAVNATSAFLCVRAVLAGMLEAGSGSIVTVASTTSLEGAPYISAYAASKHAVLGFMRVLSAELEGKGPRATTVCPTYVRTPMTVTTIENIAARTNCSLDEAERKLATVTPYGRILEVDEVTTTVLDLIETGSNGEVVLLDGAPLSNGGPLPKGTEE